MNQYDKKIREVEQKYVQQILDKEELTRTRVEVQRLDREIEALQIQRRELKEQLKSYKNSQFRTNISLGFVPKTNIFNTK